MMFIQQIKARQVTLNQNETDIQMKDSFVHALNWKSIIRLIKNINMHLKIDHVIKKS